MHQMPCHIYIMLKMLPGMHQMRNEMVANIFLLSLLSVLLFLSLFVFVRDSVRPVRPTELAASSCTLFFGKRRAFFSWHMSCTFFWLNDKTRQKARNPKEKKRKK